MDVTVLGGYTVASWFTTRKPPRLSCHPAMLPTSNARALAGTPPRHPSTFVVAWCVACAMAAALTPAGAQTAASTDKAQERSQQQSDSVYRWIKYFADQPSKVRPKTDAPQPAKKPVAKAAAEPGKTAAPAADTAADTAAAPAAAKTAPESLQQPQPTTPNVAAAAPVAPAAPEPEVIAEAPKPLRPVHVVEPTIPREMREETFNTSVRLSFTVQPDGTISTPEVIAGNNRRLNKSALQAISQWRFEPIQTARATQIEFEFRQE